MQVGNVRSFLRSFYNVCSKSKYTDVYYIESSRNKVLNFEDI